MGENVYKCDNLYEKQNNKNNFKYHITKKHISCKIGLKIFPTIQ